MMDKFDKVYQKAYLAFFALACCYVIYAYFFYYKKAERKNKDMQLIGIVDSVKYNVKGDPYIFVKGKKYFMESFFWNIQHQVEKGDSVVKTKGSIQLKIIKFKSKREIVI